MRNIFVIIGYIVVTLAASPPAFTAQHRTDHEALETLPSEWREVKHLPDGFTSDFKWKLTAQIPDGRGNVINLATPPSATELQLLKEEVSKGVGLEWYYIPNEVRYRSGPGLTGDEVFTDIQSGRFDEDCNHVAFIYGYYKQNVDHYYMLYRASGDPYYVDQIVKYAEGVEWILKNRPQQFLPRERRQQPLPDPVAAIPHEPAAMANFWPHVNAARLLLEEAKKRGGNKDDPRVIKAKQFLNTAMRYMDAPVNGQFEGTFDVPKGDRPAPKFVEGETVKMIREKYRLPERAAQVIEYTPWNQSFFYFATLTATACALKDLQAIEGNIEHQKTISTYTRIVWAAMDLFQRESDCVIKGGRPYLFHRHTPLRDGKNEYRLEHPIFNGEDTAHSQSGAWNLPYIWEAGIEFGCTTALVAAYANAMVYTLSDPTSVKKDKPWPRAHIDSPWFLAVKNIIGDPSPRLGNYYFSTLAFAPELLAANNRWEKADLPKGRSRFLILHAGTLYRMQMGK